VTQATPIRAPDNFPVHWPDPSMEEQYWTWDQMHQPHPLTPLTATFETPAFAEGATLGFRAIAIPMTMCTFVVNGYNYNSSLIDGGAVAFPPPWWPDVEQEFMRRLPGLLQSWEDEYLPEVQAMNQRLRDFDYEGASIDELFAFIEEVKRMRVRSWDIHFQVVIPVMGAASRFAETYENFLGKAEQNEHYLMLQGFENKSVESGKALWKLSREALADDAVASTFRETPIDQLAEKLRASPFWAKLQAYLDEYGWRSDAFELADPAWAEDPSIPLAQLRDMIASPDDADPAISEKRSMHERERLVEETMAMLDGHEGRPLFEMMLGVAQQYLPIQENHNFYIDQMNTVLLRLPFLELGRRLAAAGTIAERDDVFYLTIDELPVAANEPSSRDWQELVAQRRADRKRWSQVVPPRELGTPPPPEAAENPMSKLFFGERREASRDPKVITGIGASAGTVTATARVVHSLSEAHKLQPGDVLVCQMTMPAWTPLFASVSAVVADSGGVLSHCAIVAREYRIPCVVGTQNGTQLLKDGQRVTVDGAQGIVRVESA
jgi:pyruvate,water dikinase